MTSEGAFLVGIRPALERTVTTLEASLMKDDPAFTPKVDSEQRAYLGAYRDRLVSHYKRDRERLIRERREDTVNKDIQELRGSSELSETRG